MKQGSNGRAYGRRSNGERDERKRGGKEGAAVAMAAVVGVRIMENSAPVTGVQNGSPHL